jgi:hypothetical protein
MIFTAPELIFIPHFVDIGLGEGGTSLFVCVRGKFKALFPPRPHPHPGICRTEKQKYITTWIIFMLALYVVISDSA